MTKRPSLEMGLSEACEMPASGVLLGLDISKRHIGIAVCDPDRILATPVITLKRSRWQEDCSHIVALIQEHGAKGLVAGFPLHPDGRMNPAAQSRKDTAIRLAAVIAPIPLMLQDESLTTQAVEDAFTEGRWRRPRGRAPLDHYAAAIILQDAMRAVELAQQRNDGGTVRAMRVALGGLGAIGRKVAAELVKGIDGLELAAVSARDHAKARANLEAVGAAVPVVELEQLADLSDIVVECVPAACFAAIALPAISQGRIFIPLSVGQLLVHDGLIEKAQETGARILPPTGALLGLDAVRAAAEGTIHEVRMITTKPPNGLQGAPYLAQHDIDVMALTEPARIFAGSAREGAKGFPANVNVAAALSLAGIGPDRTKLEIWADPAGRVNQHQIKVEADAASFEMTIRNVPSVENPRTGKITALSTIAALRGLVSSFKAGS